MTKRISFIQRHPSLNPAEFHERWQGHHADLMVSSADAIGAVLAYQQHQRTDRDYPRAECPYDGVAVEWYESWEGWDALRTDPRYQAVRDDSHAIFGAVLDVFTDPEMEVIAGPADRGEPITKLICGVRRKAGMDRDAFHTYWWETHGALNRDTPAVRKYFLRYEQNHRSTQDYSRTDCDLDGVTIEWFRSARDFFGMAIDPEGSEVIRRDEANFLDPDGLVWMLTGPERVVFDRR